MCTHNICFYEEMMKIIFQLSSNMHIICSSLFQNLNIGAVIYMVMLRRERKSCMKWRWNPGHFTK